MRHVAVCYRGLSVRWVSCCMLQSCEISFVVVVVVVEDQWGWV